MPTRRTLLLASGGVAGAAAAGALGWRAMPDRLERRLGLGPDPYVPDAPEGVVRLERVDSAAMGGEVGLFTAVPEGYGDGAGLPVVVVLHGASASAGELQGFGLGRFVTAAVRAGTPPFVLAGTDDGPVGWTPADGADPPAMLRDELPGWLTDRGFDAGRRALWGWSRGGYGALSFAASEPTWARALALFSPALNAGDPLLDRLDSVGDLPVGLWCGDDDPFLDGTRAVAEALPEPPEVEVIDPGAHTRVFWNDHTLAMFDWLVSYL